MDANSRAMSNNTISKKMTTQMDAMFQPSLKMSRRFSYADNRVTRILLTGGPCAGKTTAMASISQDLTQLGYKVLVVPEAATLIMKGGAMIVSNAFTPEQGLMFQKALMRLQIALENTYVEIGQLVKTEPVVVLIDRGLMDGSAYVSEENWQALMDDLGVNIVQLRDIRYDAVIHMVTAANGADEFYDSLTNNARYESKEEAIEKDNQL
jgi:predicted ATPase